MFDSDDDNADGEKGEKEKVDEEADEEGVKLFLERAVQRDPVHGMVCPAATTDGLLCPVKFPLHGEEEILAKELQVWKEMYENEDLSYYNGEGERMCRRSENSDTSAEKCLVYAMDLCVKHTA